MPMESTTLPTGPIGEAQRMAAALQHSAALLSPTAAMSVQLGAPTASQGSQYGDATKLSAGTPSKPTGPAAREQLNQPEHAVVPASVTSAAAQLARQLRSNGQIGGSSSGGSRSAPAQGKRAATHGKSIWITAPPGMTPEMRLAVDLPADEFSYIERPWSHFEARWAAIDVELERFCTQAPFSVVDLGSCHGFFSLQTAAGYPQSLVVGLEGSVGVGNGTTGVQGKEEDIIETKACQTHLRWTEKLQLSNCLLAPEVWDFHRVCSLSNLGRPISSVMFNLSVLHHVDGISEKQYLAAGFSHVEGTVTLMAKFLLLANRHFIELPDAPWIEHIWNTFRKPREFLEAAARSSGRSWSLHGPLVVSEWYGRRELWLMEDNKTREVIPSQGLRALFARVIGPSNSNSGPTSWTRAGGMAESMTAAPVRATPSDHQAFAPAARTSSQQQPRAAPTNTQHQSRLPPNASNWSLQEQLGAALLAAPTALIAAHVQLRDSLADAAQTLQDSAALKEQERQATA